MVPELCPCGSQDVFAGCCQPYLSGDANASTPEALMRSRYTAFYKGNIDYLIATHHPSQRKPDDRRQLAQSIQGTDWLALRVVKTEMDPNSRDQGFVEFVAFYQGTEGSLDIPMQMHEKSAFVKEQGKWFYLQGESLPPIKIGRGGPCWCGSGKKFKQCHGKR